jgi:Tol biopolymer transport system component
VTPYALEVGVKQDWSPDGKLIVLTTNADWVRPKEPANVVTIRPDGSGMTDLTHFTGRKENAFAGSLSPDGKRIVFRLEHGQKYALAVVDRDGQNLRLLTKLGKAKPRVIDWGTRDEAKNSDASTRNGAGQCPPRWHRATQLG